MTDTSLGRNAALLYSFNQIGESLSKYALYTKQKHKDELTAKLGSEFVTQVQAAKNTDELMDVLLRGNQISSMLKVPELASQLNNLGNLKQMQFSEAKTKLTDEEKARFSAENYGNISVLQGEGEDVGLRPFSETPEFKKTLTLPPALQSQAFESAFKTYQTETTSQLVADKDKAYSLTLYSTNDRYSNPVKTAEWVKSKDGTYDNLVTEALEKAGKPKAIAEQEFKDYEQEQSLKKQIRLSNATENQWHTTFMNDPETNEPVIIAVSKPDANGNVKIKVNNKEVSDLSGVSKYKSDMPANPYENLFSYTKGLKAYQYNENLIKYPYMQVAITQATTHNSDAKDAYEKYMQNRKDRGLYEEPPIQEQYEAVRPFVHTTINTLKENDDTKKAGNNLETLRNAYMVAEGQTETYQLNYLLGKSYWDPSKEVKTPSPNPNPGVDSTKVGPLKLKTFDESDDTSALEDSSTFKDRLTSWIPALGDTIL